MPTAGRLTASSGRNCCSCVDSMFALSTQHHGLGMNKLFAGQSLPSKYRNHAATRMDAGFSEATVALNFLALFALSLCRGKLFTNCASYALQCVTLDIGSRYWLAISTHSACCAKLLRYLVSNTKLVGV